MDLANDERLRSLNDQIQSENDPQKLSALIDELGVFWTSYRLRAAMARLRHHRPVGSSEFF
jgi:hypothetical protein